MGSVSQQLASYSLTLPLLQCRERDSLCWLAHSESEEGTVEVAGRWMCGATLPVVPRWMVEKLLKVDPRWMGGGIVWVATRWMGGGTF